MFPDDCLQSLISPSNWWENDQSNSLSRGALIFAYSPHVDQIPYTFEPVGRKQATEHEHADVRVAPLKVDQPLRNVNLPVAGMPLHQNEVWAAYRAKKRACLVFSSDGVAVNKALTRGKPNHSTAPTFLAAPFYGVQQKGKRAGYSPEFVERVRHCEYSQFHWDILPIINGEESILRLGLTQPFGSHTGSFKLTGYKLSEDAMSIMDEVLTWFLWGGVPKSSLLLDYRHMIEAL